MSNMKIYMQFARVFRCSKAFNQTFFSKNEAETIEFHSHEQLDDFYHHCLSICPTFDIEYSSIYALLKGFDAAFWLHMQNEPKTQPSKKGCPFVIPNDVKPQVLELDDNAL